MKPFLIVAADFVKTGGMDVANLALAEYLAAQGHEVHLVAHSADQSLIDTPNVIFHRVPKPANSYLLGFPLIDHFGRHWAKKITARGGRVLVNGGNCRWGDVNWVHYVHASYKREVRGTLRHLKNELTHRRSITDERNAFQKARLVIANSERTKQDVIKHFDIAPKHVHTIYYGIDEEQFRPATVERRNESRRKLGLSENRLTIAFIGALGDRRKGLDRLFAAWQQLCSDTGWDADLIVVGTGVDLPTWKARVSDAGLSSRIKFMGFRNDVPTILAACDALIAPTRYEAYGLGVQEALCCGLPALVTASAGVAELYPLELRDLLIPDPENVDDLVKRLRGWRSNTATYSEAVIKLSKKLRQHSWPRMAEQIINLIGGTS